MSEDSSNSSFEYVSDYDDSDHSSGEEPELDESEVARKEEITGKLNVVNYLKLAKLCLTITIFVYICCNAADMIKSKAHNVTVFTYKNKTLPYLKLSSLELKKKELINLAKADRDYLKRCKKCRALKAEFAKLYWVEQMTYNKWVPDPSRFEGVEELIKIDDTGAAQFKEFFYLYSPIARRNSERYRFTMSDDSLNASFEYDDSDNSSGEEPELDESEVARNEEITRELNVVNYLKLAKLCLTITIFVYICCKAADMLKSRAHNVTAFTFENDSTPHLNLSPLELKKKELIDLAKADRDYLETCEKCRARKAEYGKLHRVEQLTYNRWVPDPSRFEGVEELIKIDDTGAGHFEEFFYLYSPIARSYSSGSYRFTFVQGHKRQEAMVIFGCKYFTDCHEWKFEVKDGDLYFKETFKSKHQSFQITRVYYIPHSDMLDLTPFV